METSASPRELPYRWGYFQGVALIPWSFLIVLGASRELIGPSHDPRLLSASALVMGLLGFPLSYGLLRKRKFALTLVYVMFALSLFFVGVQLTTAVVHYADHRDPGSAFFEGEMLLLWLVSMLYYRKRESQLR